MAVNVFLFSQYSELRSVISSIGNSLNFNVVAVNKTPQSTILFIKEAVLWAQGNNIPFFMLCSNQTILNQISSYEWLLTQIEIAMQKKADLLVCSARRVDSPIQTENTSLYWVSQVLGVSCMIIYSQAYSHILSLPSSFDERFEVTNFMTYGLSRKMLFSYNMFDERKDLQLLEKGGGSLCVKPIIQKKSIYQHFVRSDYSLFDYEKFSIPVYVINLEERTERLQHIREEFRNKPEFEVNILKACKDDCGALGLWLSIRKAITEAKRKQEDVIIICEDDHCFTSDYSKKHLFQQIAAGYSMGAEYMNGGCADFKNAFMITEHLFGAELIHCTQFIILYKDFYDRILAAEYDKSVLADVLLSRLTENKMLIYPFVSIQKDFGYSDVTEQFNQGDGKIGTMFAEAKRRLENIRELTLESNVLS